ncbi:unnamed protein product [Lupinus luteus]|uniref:GH16 domain-containing protein n=1 Tax=Lupinus luteus TaxID=3873 RepID=A0AAV1XSR9_LUPLU
MLMKLPDHASPGVISSFHLTSNTVNSDAKHDKISFEFLGTDRRPTLQTTIYAGATGGKGEEVKLWFDPTQDFHKYGIRFLVDDKPVRVLQQKNAGTYPKGSMAVEATISKGYDKKVIWSRGPFLLHLRGFSISPSPLAIMGHFNISM